VPVSVLEWFGHLGRDQKEQAAQSEQADRRGGGANARKRLASQTAQGENLGYVAITMLMFGLGAALPLMLLGLLSRETLLRWRERLYAAGRTGKIAMGVTMGYMLILTL